MAASNELHLKHNYSIALEQQADHKQTEEAFTGRSVHITIDRTASKKFTRHYIKRACQLAISTYAFIQHRHINRQYNSRRHIIVATSNQTDNSDTQSAFTRLPTHLLP